MTQFYDTETCELEDPDGIHPFSLASKLNSKDFPFFHEIINMSPEERNKWLDSMDEEIRNLFNQGTFEFVKRKDAENEGKEIVKTTWAYQKRCQPSGEVYCYKSCLCICGDLQTGQYDNNKTFPLLSNG